jgi:Protein of unknown function (DUF3631)
VIGKDYPEVYVGHPDEDPSDGAQLLDDIETFLARFIVYPTEHARVAHVLWIAHTWFMDAWESTPRIAFLSPEPGSGKSRALEVTEPLVPRPVHAVNTTPAYLFRKVSDPEGAPTILYDEIDTIFGLRGAKDNEDIRGMLNAGHRKGAIAGRCIVRGKAVETEELPAYCAVALAGLDDLPDTLMTRSVIIRMRRRSPSELIEPWRLRINGPAAEHLAKRLESWSWAMEDKLGTDWPDMPVGVNDRNADVWEALIAVADVAQGDWPERSRTAAAFHVNDTTGKSQSLGVTLLRDLRAIFNGHDKMATEDILAKLVAIEESPWGDLRGKQLEARGLSMRLGKYGVKPKVLRLDDHTTARGYVTEDLADPWERYLPQVAHTGIEDPDSATLVTHVTAASQPYLETDDDSEGLSSESKRKLGYIGEEGTKEDRGTRYGYQGDVTSVTSETQAQPVLLHLVHLPGRCPACEWHVETQGHAPHCQGDPA